MPPTPLAYKYVMLAAMIGFINHYAPRLNLPIDVPLKEQEIQRLHVSPLDKVVPVCSGGIRVKNYLFDFGDTHF
ncbi:MAG TPA: hypothetical protein VMB80_07415 [Candidatus Acidoferrum sp.]|nr:hypothetical protein [Candidatus Acidoferrum sp.]